MKEERMLDQEFKPEEIEIEVTLRPTTLDEFIGQAQVKENLKIAIEAALGRNESLDHILLFGPPGLGKTTLANIIATRMQAKLHQVSGPVLERAGDLAGILTNLEKGDVLYLYSDGFPDQFGGPQYKKYKYSRFREFLLSISSRPLTEQKQMLTDEFEKWKGKNEQTDDVLVIGFKLDPVD